LNRGNIFLAGAQLVEARAAYELAIGCDPNYAAAHFNLGNLSYRAGEFDLALGDYRRAIDLRPDFADAFVAMANALDSLGRTAEAAQAYKRALILMPEYAEVHFNLGVLAKNQGSHGEAASSLRRAAEIRPDLVQAHHALGNVYCDLGQLDVAETSLWSARSLDPKSPEILHDLAMCLIYRGKSPEAVRLLVSAPQAERTWATKTAFASCVARTRFMAEDPQIRATLTTAVSEAWGPPYELCQPALSMVALDPSISNYLRLANQSWPARLPTAALFGADTLAALAADSLLLALLAAAPVSMLEFERLLTCARRALLEAASSEYEPNASNVAALPFYSALARQCFINEYIFDCDDGERRAAAACRAKLLDLLNSKEAIPTFLLLAVAAYFPLFTLPDAKRLLDSNQATVIDEVLRQQILEPLEEQTLRTRVETLTSITAGVSEEVRSQYEQNPYPRWVKLPIAPPPSRFNDEMRRALPFAPFTPIQDDSALDALVAGCGTGSHSILLGRRYHGVKVLAIDLSLSSISYAKRKTLELGITNIEYAQADLLNLRDTAGLFDIIESVGVLHHLADPFAGWLTLLDLLRPGGVMGLGFYSEIARRHVVRAREIIAAHGYASTLDDIRRFRQDIVAGEASDALRWLSSMSDFYSTSECRDLLFHVQEHRLTLGQIECFLAQNGLRFIGFHLERRVFHQYRARFPDDLSGTNLSNWACFEADHPDTFVGMYRFWIQKPKDH
jgi:Flp pilus assembly protein TadD/2-polyprenyl-3-methyl-5-hydroxy-6-metoxy-1,4-benzoquinol methylase